MRPKGLTSIGLHVKKPQTTQKGDPINERNVKICKEWIQKHWKMPDRFNNKETSYELKHDVEKEAGDYVSNGDFIAAAIDLGYEFRQVEDSPNAVFKMAKK
jgi:hypothetical protein